MQHCFADFIFLSKAFDKVSKTIYNKEKAMKRKRRMKAFFSERGARG